MKTRANLKNRQGGAVAIIVGISIFLLIGMLALVIDLGHLFITKTELQSAADACALSAVAELNGAPNTTANLQRAVAAGKQAGGENRVDFQRHAVSIADSDVTFSANLPFSPGATPATTRYVMCTAHQSGIGVYFAQILGFGSQSMTAYAVATLAPGQTACAIPIGLTATKDTPDYGLTPGHWYLGRFAPDEGLTGSFDWLDYNPPAGGATEIRDLLTGQGECNVTPGQCVGQPGLVQSAEAAWNSRFGLYKPGNVDPATAPPDQTGYSYTPTMFLNPFDPNDPVQVSALPDVYSLPLPGNAGMVAGFTTTCVKVQGKDVCTSASATFPNYLQTRMTPPSPNPYSYFDECANGLCGNAVTGIDLKSNYTAQFQSPQTMRRVATAPIVYWSTPGSCGSQQTPVLAMACVLMLHPIVAPNSGTSDVWLEYLGLASNPGSPCMTYGIPGGQGSGTRVPTLVQ